MCGRYYIDDDMLKELRRVIRQLDLEISGKQDVYPSREALVLTGRGGGLAAVPMQWGIPQYTGKGLIINARAETALDKPAFRGSLLRRRCIIPAGGFYEWTREKDKAEFFRAGMPVLYMAGFYNLFQESRRFVILTTSANSSVAPVHDRMPLILEPSELEGWVSDETFMRQALEKTPLLLDRRQDYVQQTFPFI